MNEFLKIYREVNNQKANRIQLAAMYHAIADWFGYQVESQLVNLDSELTEYYHIISQYCNITDEKG